jgi:hypothetical protein
MRVVRRPFLQHLGRGDDHDAARVRLSTPWESEVEASTDGSGEWDDEPELSVRVRATGLGCASWQRYVGGIDRRLTSHPRQPLAAKAAP